MNTVKIRTCDECKYDSGVHYSEDGTRSWRPHLEEALTAEKIRVEAETATAEAHKEAFARAKQIIEDTARSLPEFSSNHTRHLMQLAQIPSGVVGAAFANLNREGRVIEHSGRYEASDDERTHGHRIGVYRSLVYRPDWQRAQA